MSLKDIIDAISTVFKLVTDSSSGTFLSVVGLILLVVAVGFAYKAATSEPSQFPPSMKMILYFSLIGGMIFSAAGPSVAMLNAVTIPKMSTERAFRNLEDNNEVKKVVRLSALTPRAVKVM